MTGKTLCLNMIVKNEMANLERCLRAVAPYIACWVIGDTGSSDGTQEFIRPFFAARNIPGELHSFPFVNFEQARNEALDRARTSGLKFDYVLLTDADMELTVQNPGFTQDLTLAAYKVRQRSGVTYWNNRLLRRGVSASYKGVTHEYLDVREGKIGNLEGIGFIDHATGANRVEKYERDARLLTDAIGEERDPAMIARYTFYLANTLRDSGQREAALETYLKRSRLGNWQQEVFMSLLDAARLKEALGYSNDEIIAAYAAAAAACPARGEAPHGASRFCREKGLHERGMEFAAKGLAIPYPKDALFVQDWIYEYGLLDEFAVNAYWTGRYAECVNACDRLLCEGKLPADKRERVLKNKSFAVGKLREVAALPSSGTGAFIKLLGAARQKEELGSPDDEVISAYIEAAAACPSRAEALHGAARYCRNRGIYQRGYEFASRGLAMAHPKDAPAVEDWIYEYGLLDELAVNAYWIGRYTECANACHRLLSEGKLPAEKRERVLKNKQCAIDKLGEVNAPKSIAGDARDGAGPPGADSLPVARSFDLFDTLVARRCVHPHTIFDIVERASGCAGFAKARRAAEAEISAGSYTLDDIYRRLAEHHDVSAPEADRLKALELETEAANLFPIVQHCREVGSDDVIVSDMYLPAEWLMQIVRKTCGAAPRSLYVSSHGKRKGTVWRIVQRAARLMEHVGDNPVTDQESAQASGIPARLTSVARRSEIEDEFAAAGFVPLSNLIREARLTAWHHDPELRRAQIAQVQINFPLLFLTTLHLRKLSADQGWDHILMSARDCYLWHGLYQRMRPLLPGAPGATYFYTSRIARAHPSPGYLAYFSSQCMGRRNVVADLCGTGWSLSRLIAQAPEPAAAIFLLHKLEMPNLVRDYERFGALADPIGVHSIVARAPRNSDNEVLERMNFATHASVNDVGEAPDGFRPLLSSLTYPDEVAKLVQAHHAAFGHACELLRGVTASEISEMLTKEIVPAIEAVYGRAAGMLPQFGAFGAYKAGEETLARQALEKASAIAGGKAGETEKARSMSSGKAA
jgi:glycosyltransferase involved in cell wall biosynthesis